MGPDITPDITMGGQSLCIRRMVFGLVWCDVEVLRGGPVLIPVLLVQCTYAPRESKRGR